MIYPTPMSQTLLEAPVVSFGAHPAQLALDEPTSEIQRTLDEYAAVIEHTGMCLHDRDLAELRVLLSERVH